MKYIINYKTFENQEFSGLTTEQEKFLESYCEHYYEENGVVNCYSIIIDGNRDNIGKPETFEGIRFGTVEYIEYKGKWLEDLNCFPETVIHNCHIEQTSIKNLEGNLKTVSGNLVLSNNQKLEDLKGCPNNIKGHLFIYKNPNVKSIENVEKVECIDIIGSTQLRKINFNPKCEPVEIQIEKCSISSLLGMSDVFDHALKSENPTITITDIPIISLFGIEKSAYMYHEYIRKLGTASSLSLGSSIVEIKDSVLSNGLYSYIKTGSWRTYHRYLLVQYREAVKKWFIDYALPEEKMYFLESLDVNPDNPDDIIATLVPIFFDSEVKKYSASIGVNSNLQGSIETKTDLDKLGF
jgi:hypothetical protein